MKDNKNLTFFVESNSKSSILHDSKDIKAFFKIKFFFNVIKLEIKIGIKISQVM